MTNEEAKQHIEHQEVLDQEIAIDSLALDMAAKALEKQIAKKAVDIFSYGIDEGVFKFGHCPTCGFGIAYDSVHNFCPNCGQKLDWKEKEI